MDIRLAVMVVMEELGYTKQKYVDTIDNNRVRHGYHFWLDGDKRISDKQALRKCLDLNILADIHKKYQWNCTYKYCIDLVPQWSFAIQDKGHTIESYSKNIRDAAL